MITLLMLSVSMSVGQGLLLLSLIGFEGLLISAIVREVIRRERLKASFDDEDDSEDDSYDDDLDEDDEFDDEEDLEDEEDLDFEEEEFEEEEFDDDEEEDDLEDHACIRRARKGYPLGT